MKYLLALILVLPIISAHAEVYKWVDESGSVHYGDKPVSGSQTIDVPEHTNSAYSSDKNEDEFSRDEKRQRVTDMLEEDRLEKEKKRNEAEKERERKRMQCGRLKDRQRSFERARSLYKLDKDGTRHYMSNEQRKKSEQNLLRQIRKACS